MIDIQSILKPRRGKESTMKNSKKDTVLQSGEIFIEVPDEGVGKGDSKIKIGDGTSTYEKLPYALGNESERKITFAPNTSSTSSTALNSVTSGNALGVIIAGLKQAVTKINSDISSMKTSFQDGVDQIYNKCKSCGSTPSTSSPDSICTAIQNIYNNRYNSGYNAGDSAGYSRGYSAGKSAGYNEGYSAGQSNVKGNASYYKVSTFVGDRFTSKKFSFSNVEAGTYLACVSDAYTGGDKYIVYGHNTVTMNVSYDTLCSHSGGLGIYKFTISSTTTVTVTVSSTEGATSVYGSRTKVVLVKITP